MLVSESLDEKIVAKIDGLYLRYTILCHVGNTIAFFILAWTNQLNNYTIHFLGVEWFVSILSVRRIVHAQLGRQEQQVLDQLKYLL